MKARNQKFGTVMKNHSSDPSPHTVIQKFGSGFQVICHELTEKKDNDEATAEGFIYRGFPSIMFKYDSGKIEAFDGDRVVSPSTHSSGMRMGTMSSRLPPPRQVHENFAP